ncbi:hypothetical protein QTP88_026215 [Uroleucon formosanum]
MGVQPASDDFAGRLIDLGRSTRALGLDRRGVEVVGTREYRDRRRWRWSTPIGVHACASGVRGFEWVRGGTRRTFDAAARTLPRLPHPLSRPTHPVTRNRRRAFTSHQDHIATTAPYPPHRIVDGRPAAAANAAENRSPWKFVYFAFVFISACR